MNSLLKFIQQYSNFLVFVLLEVVAFLCLAANREYPKSYFLTTSNAIVARHSERISRARAFLRLRETNEVLEAENIRLRNEVVALQNCLEAQAEQSDYHYAHLDYSYQPAKVVQAVTNKRDNYLTINKGARDSVYRGMGVCNPDGVVGIVATVGERFSLVLPVINVKSRISCMFDKNGYFATIEWHGNDIRHVDVADVAAHVQITEGDTIVTSGLTSVFPANLPIAVVDEASLETGDSYYTIRARVLTDFRRLNYVQLIRNNTHQELDSLTHAGIH